MNWAIVPVIRAMTWTIVPLIRAINWAIVPLIGGHKTNNFVEIEDYHLLNFKCNVYSTSFEKEIEIKYDESVLKLAL
jgi:hypothetical protein